jgi:signal transduction histidine kinase/ActR/RegA family two-component response regulator
MMTTQGLVLVTRTAPSLRSRLFLLAVSLFIPLFLGVVYLLQSAYHRDREYVERHLLETARALSLVVDRQFAQAETALWALAASPYLESGDLAALDAQARRILRTPNNWFLLEGTGRQLVNTYLPPGASLPEIASQEHWRSSDGKQVHVSNLFRGTIAQQPAVGSSLIVQRGDRQYFLSVIMLAKEFNSLLAEQDLPPNWVRTVLDGAGTVVARNREADKFVGRPATPDVAQHIREGKGDQVFLSTSLDGVRTVAALSRSRTSGWSFLVGVPERELTWTARLSARQLLIVGGLLALLASALITLAARAIAKPVELLAIDASALGRGAYAAIRREGRGFHETEVVRKAIAAAADALVQREAERDRALTTLEELNQTLERRVAERTEELADANQRLVAEMDERRQAEARLAQAQRLEAVGQLTGGLAHDFNNLLQALGGCLDMIRRRSHEQQVQTLLDAGQQAVNRGAKLVQQLMAFAKRDSLRPEPIDIRDRVLAMSTLLDQAVRADIRIDSVFSPGLWPIVADPTQFELALINLAVNARDAMPNGGILTIAANNVKVEAGHPTVLAGDFVQMSVADTGCGMPADVLAKAFEPFFTTKGVGQGSGLGLAQVYGLARQADGAAWIDSVPGHGTTVHLLLRRSDTHPALSAAPALPVVHEARQRGHVLVVEDDAIVAMTVAIALEDAGFRVTRAVTADEALAVLAAQDVDLLFSDVVMPGNMSGIDLAREAQRTYPRLPIVLATGYSEDIARASGLQVVAKPYRIESLIGVLDAALAERQTEHESA